MNVVVVETETGVLSVAVAVLAAAGMVVVVVVAVGCATRMQQRTPRLRPRAPSTPTSKGNGGSFFFISEREMIEVSYSVPSCGMNRSNPESGVAAVGKREPHAESVIF